MKNILLLTAFATLLFACKKDNTSLLESRLAGTWIFQGQNLDANFMVADYTTIIVKGMTINNAGELTFDAATDSFHFSNYSYEIDLPRTHIVHTVNKGDSTYITHYNTHSPVVQIEASYKLSGTNSLKIAGRNSIWFPASPINQYRSEFTVGWAGDTLLLLDNFASFRFSETQNATLKFVRK